MAINIPISYPDWWNASITLYNRYDNPVTDEIKWYRTIITGCFFNSVRTTAFNGQVIYNTNNNIVRIRQSKQYKNYAEWVQIPNIEQAQYFTLHTGDIIVKGEINDIIDEYTNGKRSTDLINKYKNLSACLTIDLFRDNTGVGRGTPHYYVEGQ